MKPFRWDITRREQLGSLPDVWGEISVYRGYTRDLAECAARVLARSFNRRLVFVGRSPENIFDYLSGVLADTVYADRLDLLNVSLRDFPDVARIKTRKPEYYRMLCEHLDATRLSPADIIADPRGVCFCDLVAGGTTFEQIYTLLETRALDEGLDLAALQRKISFLGLTPRKKTSPNTWRWQQHASWVKQNRLIQVKNLSISWLLWDYLGNWQSKTTPSHTSWRWGTKESLRPPRQYEHTKALKQAYQIHERARDDRPRFLRRLARTPEIKERWLRTLIQDLKRS